MRMAGPSQVADQMRRAAEWFSGIACNLEADTRRRDSRRPSIPGLVINSVIPDALTLIDPPTSDEDSDTDLCGPNVRMVTEAVLDSQMTKISVSPSQDEYVPCSYQLPALIFFHLDSHMVASHLLTVFQHRYQVAKVQMVDFAGDSGFSHCGIVYFRSAEEGKVHVAQKLYKKLKIEEVDGTLGSRVHRIPGAQRTVNVKWIRNETLSDQSEWSAVVLRNLPANFTLEAIASFLNTKAERPVLRLEPPRNVKGKYCTLAVTRNIEDAEKLCKRLNNVKVATETVKVHVHPMSKGRRREDSHHRLFNSAPVKKPRTQSVLLEKLLTMFPSEAEKGPMFEDGEIPDMAHQAPVPPAPVSRYYSIYEHSGFSYFPQGFRQHAGMRVMTTHINDEENAD